MYNPWLKEGICSIHSFPIHSFQIHFSPVQFILCRFLLLQFLLCTSKTQMQANWPAKGPGAPPKYHTGRWCHLSHNQVLLWTPKLRNEHPSQLELNSTMVYFVQSILPQLLLCYCFEMGALVGTWCPLTKAPITFCAAPPWCSFLFHTVECPYTR